MACISFVDRQSFNHYHSAIVSRSLSIRPSAIKPGGDLIEEHRESANPQSRCGLNAIAIHTIRSSSKRWPTRDARYTSKPLFYLHRHSSHMDPNIINSPLCALSAELILKIAHHLAQPPNSTESCSGNTLLSSGSLGILLPLRLSCRRIDGALRDDTDRFEETFFWSHMFSFDRSSDLARMLLRASRTRLDQIHNIHIQNSGIRAFPFGRGVEFRELADLPSLVRVVLDLGSVDYLWTPKVTVWEKSKYVKRQKYLRLQRAVFSRLPVLQQGVVLEMRGDMPANYQSFGQDSLRRIGTEPVKLKFRSNGDGDWTEMPEV